MPRLADAAPRLEVLTISRTRHGGSDASVAAAAVQGHPCLHELRVYPADKAWLVARHPAAAGPLHPGLETV